MGETKIPTQEPHKSWNPVLIPFQNIGAAKLDVKQGLRVTGWPTPVPRGASRGQSVFEPLARGA